MLKVVKEQSRLAKFIKGKLKIGVGLERLFFFIMLFTILCHIVSCLW